MKKGRTLSSIPIAIVAFWLTASAAHAVLYVGLAGTGGVATYDDTTGAVINPSFAGGAGSQGGYSLLLNGNTLYVGDPSFRNVVSTYDATTGATLNSSFVNIDAKGLALSGNVLYVSSPNEGTIGTYDATTGAAINASLITGLSNEFGAIALSGNTLYVAYGFGIGTYNATTGEAINPNFIGTVGGTATAIIISGNNLYVPGGRGVLEYDATTGAAINRNFISGLEDQWGLAISGNDLFVSSVNPQNGFGVVGEYDATTGAAINANFGSTSPDTAPRGLLDATPTPEPSGAVLLALGGTLLGCRRRGVKPKIEP